MIKFEIAYKTLVKNTARVFKAGISKIIVKNIAKKLSKVADKSLDLFIKVLRDIAKNRTIIIKR